MAAILGPSLITAVIFGIPYACLSIYLVAGLGGCYELRMELRKIDKAPPTLRDMVQERLREAIISGHFAPGDRLVERPLCEQLGVSRTVIRETVRYLEAEGLVEIVPQKGRS